MLLGNSQKEETNKAIIRRLYSLLFFTLFTTLYMKGILNIAQLGEHSLLRGDVGLETYYYNILFFFTLFTALYMKGRYITMKNLKKTVKDVKDNNKDLILYGGLFVVSVVSSVVGIKRIKASNSMIKK